MEENIGNEAESESEQNHTPEYVRTIYNELGMQGALDLMHKDYMPDDPESYDMTPFYARGRAYFWVYREILEYAINPRHDNDNEDDTYGINTYSIISHFGSWGELRRTKDDFIVYLIQCIIETMHQRGIGLPEAYAKLTFGFEQAENIKKENIKGLIFFAFGDAFDLETPITLKRDDAFFRLFFLIRLSLIEPYQIDEFLEYQLQVSFDNDVKAFRRFTSLLLRHHRKWKTPKIEGDYFYHKIVKKKYIKTVDEWFMFFKPAFELTKEPESEKIIEEGEMPKLNDKSKKQYEKQPQADVPSLEWLGTQKELGELLIVLKEKGWIKDFIYKTIMSLFTNAHTIDQILKPSFDVKTKKPHYEQIYTQRYQSKFKNIHPNPKSK